ncbi:MAG: hypothetical protein VB095_01310 [Anaerovorax sp.]|nr:hypothetical protein [Anaerovorax sp.]
MIKMPKEINRILQSLDQKGYEIYLTGACVREGLLGKNSNSWDLIGNAPLDEIKELVPELEIVSEDYGYAEISEGELLVEFSVTDNVEEALKEAVYTIESIADNPNRTLLDLYGGKNDVSKKLVRTNGEPKPYFERDPLLILKGIALAAEADFDIEMDTFEAMTQCVSGLKDSRMEDIRDAFGKIITAQYAAKGLRMAMAIGIMPYVLGENCFPPKSRNEANDFQILMENYDCCRFELEYRYALLFLCFEKKRALEAIHRLKFDSEMEEKMILVQNLVPELYFVVQPFAFKKFLGKHGFETYEYAENVTKQQRKVYNHAENRVLSRFYMLQEFEKIKMPVYVDDLVIKVEDLKEVGITDEEEAKEMLKMLLDMVHAYPRKNERKILLKKAKEFKKNPIKRMLRGVQWMK